MDGSTRSNTRRDINIDIYNIANPVRDVDAHSRDGLHDIEGSEENERV